MSLLYAVNVLYIFNYPIYKYESAYITHFHACFATLILNASRYENEDNESNHSLKAASYTLTLKKKKNEPVECIYVQNGWHSTRAYFKGGFDLNSRANA